LGSLPAMNMPRARLMNVVAKSVPCNLKARLAILPHAPT